MLEIPVQYATHTVPGCDGIIIQEELPSATNFYGVFWHSQIT